MKNINIFLLSWLEQSLINANHQKLFLKRFSQFSTSGPVFLSSADLQFYDTLLQSTRMYKKYVNEPPLYKSTSQVDLHNKMATSSYQNLDYRKLKGKENDDRFVFFFQPFAIFSVNTWYYLA